MLDFIANTHYFNINMKEASFIYDEKGFQTEVKNGIKRSTTTSF